MSNSINEKVFRKEYAKPSEVLQDICYTIIALFAFSILATAFFGLWSLVCYYDTALTLFCFSISAAFILIIPAQIVLAIVRDNDYTLTLKNDKLVYESKSETAMVSLPCYYREKDGDIEVTDKHDSFSIYYNPKTDQDLIEFLDGVIN